MEQHIFEKIDTLAEEHIFNGTFRHMTQRDIRRILAHVLKRMPTPWEVEEFLLYGMAYLNGNKDFISSDEGT